MKVGNLVGVILLLNQGAWASDQECPGSFYGTTNSLESLMASIKVKAPSKVKTLGSITISSVVTPELPKSKCGSAGKLEMRISYKLGKNTNLKRAIEVYSNPATVNEIQAKYEEDRDPYAKNVAVKKAPNATGGYDLIGNTKIKFMFINVGERNVKNHCTETHANPKVWTKACDIDKSYKDGGNIFAESSYVNQCEEKMDGVTCNYTQITIMKPQCGTISKSGMFLALANAERSAAVQTALAEMAAQDLDEPSSELAYESFSSSSVDQNISSFLDSHEGTIDQETKIVQIIQ